MKRFRKVIITVLLFVGCTVGLFAFWESHDRIIAGETDFTEDAEMFIQQFNVVKDTLNEVKQELLDYPEVKSVRKDADDSNKLLVDTDERLFDTAFHEKYPDLYEEVKTLSDFGI